MLVFTPLKVKMYCIAILSSHLPVDGGKNIHVEKYSYVCKNAIKNAEAEGFHWLF